MLFGHPYRFRENHNYWHCLYESGMAEVLHLKWNIPKKRSTSVLASSCEDKLIGQNFKGGSDITDHMPRQQDYENGESMNPDSWYSLLNKDSSKKFSVHNTCNHAVCTEMRVQNMQAGYLTVNGK